jgi:hypothetical protein
MKAYFYFAFLLGVACDLEGLGAVAGLKKRERAYPALSLFLFLLLFYYETFTMVIRID